jgi:hypothetical protein
MTSSAPYGEHGEHREHDGRLWKWYAATEVAISLPDGSTATVRPAPEGESGPWPWGRYEEAWILAACNPRSVPLSEADNRARHRLLSRDLEAIGATFYAADGYDPQDAAWVEPGFCVMGISEVWVNSLARRWEQNAIFHWTPAAWTVVGALLPGRERLGWTLG